MFSKVILYFFPANLFRFVLIGKHCHVQPSGTLFPVVCRQLLIPPPSSPPPPLYLCVTSKISPRFLVSQEVQPNWLVDTLGSQGWECGPWEAVAPLSCPKSENLLELRFLLQWRYVETANAKGWKKHWKLWNSHSFIIFLLNPKRIKNTHRDIKIRW